MEGDGGVASFDRHAGPERATSVRVPLLRLSLLGPPQPDGLHWRTGCRLAFDRARATGVEFFITERITAIGAGSEVVFRWAPSTPPRC